MAAINLPFGASALKRAPNTDELANGFGCGDADKELFDWLAWWETGQVANAIAKSGLTVDDTDLLRLAKAIRSQGMNYRAAAGTANAITITLDPAPAALSDLLGVPLRIKTGGSANSGAVTLAPNGLAATAVRGADGLDLLAGELPASTIFEVAYNSSFFQIINRPVPAAQRAPSAFNMTTSAAQAIAASTLTVVTNFAIGSNDTLDSTLAGNQITIGTKDAGWWVVTGKLMYDFPASGTMETNIIIERNGNEVGAGNAYGSTAIRARPQASTVVKLAAGDVMRLQTTTTTARSLTNGSSVFSGFKVGA